MKKKILVTGGNGQLAKCIKDLDSNRFVFFFESSSSLDITNKLTINNFFNTHNIDWCINCAAYTAVDKAETDTENAYNVNVLGSKNLAESCKKNRVKLIHISTDFVFSGEQAFPYKETDRLNPINNYGKTKLLGEKEISSIVKEHFIIRTSWLYSEHGNNFLKTMLRLGRERNELNVVGDQIGTPTYAGDLAKVILKIIDTETSDYDVYHYSNAGVASWYDFAKAIFDISSIEINLNKITTNEFPTPAKRPEYSVLDKSKIENAFGIEVPNWEKSLKKALKNLERNKNLEIAITASLEAGKAILDIYDNPIEVEFKEDNSPLTKADTKSNDIINSFLKPTKIPIISEETKQTDFEIRKNWKAFWLVDPLDGTKEFLKRNGEFTVNIALVEDGIPTLGVIYAPAVKTIYFADTNKKQAYKAKLESHETNLKDVLELSKLLNPKKNKSDKINVVCSRSHLNKDILDFVKELENKENEVNIVSKGSSVKFCLVAEGNADVYPRFTPTMEWDTAAGHAICNALEIKVISQETKKPLIYNKENLLNDYFLVSIY